MSTRHSVYTQPNESYVGPASIQNVGLQYQHLMCMQAARLWR